MPTVFIIEGFRFFFYSNDHAPLHVHVQHGEYGQHVPISS